MLNKRNIATPAPAWAGVLIFLAFWSTPFPASAQTSTATVTGTVRDSSGAVLPGVTITVTHTGRNTSQSTISNDTGNYVIPALNPGTYSLSAELTGFKKFFTGTYSSGKPGGTDRYPA